MSVGAIISMVGIIGVVLGGFIFFLRLAMKKEGGKKPD
ncbi:MAG: MetS family NSS transporter small subunit [Fulvivirga sp.]